MCRLAAHDRLRDAAYHWARVAAQRDPVSHDKYQALRARGHRPPRPALGGRPPLSPARCSATAPASTRTVPGPRPRERHEALSNLTHKPPVGVSRERPRAIPSPHANLGRGHDDTEWRLQNGGESPLLTAGAVRQEGGCPTPCPTGCPIPLPPLGGSLPSVCIPAIWARVSSIR